MTILQNGDHHRHRLVETSLVSGYLLDMQLLYIIDIILQHMSLLYGNIKAFISQPTT